MLVAIKVYACYVVMWSFFPSRGTKGMENKGRNTNILGQILICILKLCFGIEFGCLTVNILFDKKNKQCFILYIIYYVLVHILSPCVRLEFLLLNHIQFKNIPSLLAELALAEGNDDNAHNHYDFAIGAACFSKSLSKEMSDVLMSPTHFRSLITLNCIILLGDRHANLLVFISRGMEKTLGMKLIHGS